MNKSGTYVTNLQGDTQYKSFRPAPLPPELTIDEELLQKTADATKKLAELDSYSRLIPNTELFTSMYVRKEALLSSQIEGTQCTLDDVLDPNLSENTNLDVADVVNYVNAVNYSTERLQTLPLCNRLLKETHKVLLSGVRGSEKNPGEFRKSQNWIGPAGCTIREARYVCPNTEDMIASMNDLENYIHTEDTLNPLIRTALIHYQFETIHPFLDGNGRIGRLLILLYLMDQHILSKPVLYVSYFLKKNQIEYYDRMSEVRRTGNYEQWIKFFLDALILAAEDATRTSTRLNELHQRNLSLLPSRKTNVHTLFEYIEQHPIIDVRKTATALNVSYNTVSAAVRTLMQSGILTETKNISRNRIFIYKEYLDILRENT